jgi:allantoinase
MQSVESVLVVRSHRIVLPEGERSAALHISGGIIERIVEYASEDPTGARVFNVPDLVISPGLVDTHVHINEPGRTEWEGFDTATRAAACGGITTLVDMPLNSVPATTCVSGLHAKIAAARAQCHVDVGFWGGVVPGNAPELDPLIDAGVRGFKCFLVPSGVDEFPPVTEDDLRGRCPFSRAATCRCWCTPNSLRIADCGLRIRLRNPIRNPIRNPQSTTRNTPRTSPPVRRPWNWMPSAC